MREGILHSLCWLIYAGTTVSDIAVFVLRRDVKLQPTNLCWYQSKYVLNIHEHNSAEAHSPVPTYRCASVVLKVMDFH